MPRNFGISYPDWASVTLAVAGAAAHSPVDRVISKETMATSPAEAAAFQARLSAVLTPHRVCSLLLSSTLHDGNAQEVALRCTP